MQRVICEAMREKMADGGVCVTFADSFTAAMRETAGIGGSNNLRGVAIRGTGRAHAKPGGGYGIRDGSAEPTALFERVLLPQTVFERVCDFLTSCFHAQ